MTPTPKERRLSLIDSLQTIRESKVISFITSTREGLDFPIAMDSIRKVFEHIKIFGSKKNKPKIDLFIHSNGGDGIVPWKLVTLIRDYCSQFSVIVPHRAFSAATLISLGADEILMHPMGMLGPIDPTVTNLFNPQDPRNPNQLLGISVEDVSAYIKLVREDFGITHEDEVIHAVDILAQKVHPLALGNVKRFHSQSRMLAKKLLELHMKNGTDDHKIDEIVDNLNSKLFFHGHPIYYKEAQELGLKVKLATKTEQDLIWRLYEEYEESMSLDEEFRPVDYFLAHRPDPATSPPSQPVTIDLPKVRGVYIESMKRTDARTADFQVLGSESQGVVNTQVLTNRISWEKE